MLAALCVLIEATLVNIHLPEALGVSCMSMLIGVFPQGLFSDQTTAATLKSLSSIGTRCETAKLEAALEIYNTIGNRRISSIANKKLLAYATGIVLVTERDALVRATLFRTLTLLGDDADVALPSLRKYRDCIDKASVAWDQVDGRIQRLESLRHR